MTPAQRAEKLTISGGGNFKRIIGKFVLEKKPSLRVYHPADRGGDIHLQGGAGPLRQGPVSGWREFASEGHYQETHYSDADPNLPFHENNSAKDIISLMCSLQMERLMDTADLTSPGRRTASRTSWSGPAASPSSA